MSLDPYYASQLAIEDLACTRTEISGVLDMTPIAGTVVVTVKLGDADVLRVSFNERGFGNIVLTSEDFEKFGVSLQSKCDHAARIVNVLIDEGELPEGCRATVDYEYDMV